MLRFSTTEHLLTMKDDMRLTKILSSVSCFVTVAKAEDVGEVTQLMDLLSGINVKEKHLHVKLSSALENNAFENISISFNVVVELQTSGAFDYNSSKIFVPILSTC